MPKKLPEFVVIKDTREQQGWEFEEEEKRPGKCRLTSMISGKLDTGDYSVKGLEDIFSIERKNGFSELFGNLGGKVARERFIREMERMSKIKHPFILVETSLNEDTMGLGVPQMQRGMPCSAILGHLMQIAIDYNVNIMFVGDCGQTVSRKIFESICRTYL